MPISPDSLKAIHAVVLDVDGVLTDGSVIAAEDGALLRQMNIKDGFALQHAVKAGLRIGVITGGKSAGVRQRLEGLGITDLYMGASEKLSVYESLLAQWGLGDTQVCYIGDDMPDMPVLRRVGLAVAPADAASDVLAAVHHVTAKPGGHGCVREVLEAILKAQNRWDSPVLHQW